jgi:hypothetical protein
MTAMGPDLLTRLTPLEHEAQAAKARADGDTRRAEQAEGQAEQWREFPTSAEKVVQPVNMCRAVVSVTRRGGLLRFGSGLRAGRRGRWV